MIHDIVTNFSTLLKKVRTKLKKFDNMKIFFLFSFDRILRRQKKTNKRSSIAAKAQCENFEILPLRFLSQLFRQIKLYQNESCLKLISRKFFSTKSEIMFFPQFATNSHDDGFFILRNSTVWQ